MANDIKVGDMVQVVKWPCCGKEVGVTRCVTQVDRFPWFAEFLCAACGAKHDTANWPFGIDTSIPEGVVLVSFPLAWVKRIDPPGEDTTLDEREPVLCER